MRRFRLQKNAAPCFQPARTVPDAGGARHHRHRPSRKIGAVLALALVALLVVSLFVAAMMQAVVTFQRRSRMVEELQQARWLAESAIQRARYSLAKSHDYRGERWLIPADVAGTRRPAQVLIRIDPIDQSPSRRLLLIETMDPESDVKRVLFRCERTIEVPNSGERRAESRERRAESREPEKLFWPSALRFPLSASSGPPLSAFRSQLLLALRSPLSALSFFWPSALRFPLSASSGPPLSALRSQLLLALRSLLSASTGDSS